VEGEKRHQYHPLLVFDLLKTNEREANYQHEPLNISKAKSYSPDSAISVPLVLVTMLDLALATTSPSVPNYRPFDFFNPKFAYQANFSKGIISRANQLLDTKL